MAFASTPTLYAYHKIALAQDPEFDSLQDSPFETFVNVLLPVGVVEVRLSLWEQERVDSAVKMRIL